MNYRTIETRYRPAVPILAIDPPAGGAISSKAGSGKCWLEQCPEPRVGQFEWSKEKITKVSPKSGGGVFCVLSSGLVILYTSSSAIHHFCEDVVRVYRQHTTDIPLILLEDGIPQNNKLMRSVGVVSGFFYALFGVEPVIFAPKKAWKYEAWREWCKIYVGEQIEIGAHEASAFNLFDKWAKAYQEKSVVETKQNAKGVHYEIKL